MPRFRNLFRQETDFLRGYATGFSAGRNLHRDTSGNGEELKSALENPKLGSWYVSSHMMGETIPKETNSIRLHDSRSDDWGMPLLEVDIDYDDNDRKMELDALEQLSEMYEAAGFKNIRTRHDRKAPGLDIHEMGGVRMGKDSENLPSKQMESASFLPKCIRDRRCLHDINLDAESFADLHGYYC